MSEESPFGFSLSSLSLEPAIAHTPLCYSGS